VDPAAALEQLREVIHTNNRNSLSGRHAIDAWASYGLLLLAQQQKAEAAKVAATLETGFGGNPLSLRMAAALFTALGDEDSLRRLLRSTGDGDALLQASIIGGLAEALLRRKPTAEDLYTALRLHPDRVEIVTAIVNRLLQLGATGELASALRRVEEIAPGMVARWRTITTDAIANASPQGAAVMRAMAMQMPDPMPSRMGIAIMLGALGKITLAEAQTELRAVVAERPDLADLCRGREASMLIKLRLVDEAAQLLAPYAQRDDAPLAIVTALVELYDARKDGEAAMRLLRRAAERFPEEARDALEQLADRLINAKRYGEARELLDRLEQDAPLDYGLMISRAQAFGDDGKFDAGLRVLAALEREGNLTDERRALMCRLRGRYLREAGRIPASIDAFQEAIRLNSRDPFTRMGLAKAYRLAKRFREAYETLLDGVALAPARLAEFESELRELQELAAQPKKPKGTKRRKVRRRTGGRPSPAVRRTAGRRIRRR
jgi:tetratricopeptide (TPR) repeat protein